MRILYGGRKTRAGKPGRIQVRESRFGRELWVDGTFASLHRPGEVATGSVWDALAAGVLALKTARQKKVAILGLGAGSCARLVRALLPDAEILGVEFDPEIVRVARRHFGLDDLGVEVVVADAREFLGSTRRRFDAILEDVFIGSGDAVCKPAWLPQPGLALAARRLRPGGVLVSNALDEAAFVSFALRDLFPTVVRIEVRDYDNQVFVAGGLSARALRARIFAEPTLRDALALLRLRTEPPLA